MAPPSCAAAELLVFSAFLASQDATTFVLPCLELAARLLGFDVNHFSLCYES